MLEVIDDYAILFLDRHGNVGNWNKEAEKIKGYTEEEIVGRNFSVFYNEESRKNRLPELLIEEARSKGRAQHEGWRVKKGGKLYWSFVTLSAIYDDNNSVIGFSKFVRDLTARHNQEKTTEEYARELELKNKELEQFVYIASHDLQEPLLTVKNFVELFKDEYKDVFDDNAKLYLQFIDRSTERMRNLIKGLLDYARLGGKQIKTLVDCNVLLHSLENDLFSSITTARATICYEDLPVIYGYETALRQLFQNLLSNSLKFKHPYIDPEISISVVNRENFWHFEFKDNGIGIEERYQEKVFVMFQRLHSASDYEGYGIGLSHCKKIVELHGGQISVDSALGEGSTFRFTLRV
ncbi:sensor histidine kinase [Pedobacter africanus]|uniref:histidine kinase n=1 Tax=Pedobacter africanus TaxID=151894 RepID=A0A1W2CZ12_9SPHI|nr:ATP-binding protein [Pedobacter africanus]SMC90072.1 PAS domain S-box-containing protein [Pedobacter africanus]